MVLVQCLHGACMVPVQCREQLPWPPPVRKELPLVLQDDDDDSNGGGGSVQSGSKKEVLPLGDMNT